VSKSDIGYHSEMDNVFVFLVSALIVAVVIVVVIFVPAIRADGVARSYSALVPDASLISGCSEKACSVRDPNGRIVSFHDCDADLCQVTVTEPTP
jgi:hypothetical protein